MRPQVDSLIERIQERHVLSDEILNVAEQTLEQMFRTFRHIERTEEIQPELPFPHPDRRLNTTNYDGRLEGENPLGNLPQSPNANEYISIFNSLFPPDEGVQDSDSAYATAAGTAFHQDNDWIGLGVDGFGMGFTNMLDARDPMARQDWEHR